jgi:hypothetical protein
MLFSKSSFTYIYDESQQAKVEGVTLDTPPNSKIFDTANRSNDDLGIISRRRNALGTQNTNSPNITFSLAGLPELLGLNPTPNRNIDNRDNLPAAPAPTSRRPPNTTPFVDFSFQYSFSNDLHTKLENAHVTGPHLLRLITDENLKSAGLSFAQIAQVRDSYERWLEDEFAGFNA